MQRTPQNEGPGGAVPKAHEQHGYCQIGIAMRHAVAVATDARSRRRLALYWLLIRGGSGLIRREVLRVVARRAEMA